MSKAKTELDFVKAIGQLGEPAETQIIVDAARDFWIIWPQIRETDQQTGRSVAETNVRTALSLINLFDGDKELDHERLLLAAVTKNVEWRRVTGSVDENSSEFHLARKQANVKTLEFSASAKHIFNLAKDLTAVKRDILLSATHWEDDSEHTLSTALISWKFAKQFAPELDMAEVLKMALVHELAETITGDISSFALNEKQLRAKKVRDATAAKQLAQKFRDCPKLVAKFLQYESKASREARFVYWVDKILPVFSKYQPDERKHSFAPVEEIYELNGVSQIGRNFNHETITAYGKNVRNKLLGAGAVPHSICEKLLAQELMWLHWLNDVHERSEI